MINNCKNCAMFNLHLFNSFFFMTYNIVLKGRLCSITSILSAFFVQQYHQLLNPPKISYTTLFKIYLTAVLQSKHILREPRLCVSDYVQPSSIQVGWLKWAFMKKRLYTSERKLKLRILHCNREIHELNFGLDRLDALS